MAGEVAAERLYVQIVADATGFRKDLNEKVRAASEKARVKIRAEIDDRRLAVEARAAAREASKTATVKLKAEFSAKQVRDSLNKALREGTRNQAVKARVEFDPTQAKASLNRALLEGSRSGNTVRGKVEFSQTQVRAALARALRDGINKTPVIARVEFNPAQVRAALARALRASELGQAARLAVLANTARFTAQAEAARRVQEARPVHLRLETNAAHAAQAIRAAGSALRTLTIGPAVASGLLVLAGSITNVVGGLFAMASAASQAVGVLAVLPGLAAAAAQGLSVLALGFSGIGGALKAMSAADKTAATTAGKSASTQTRSLDQIKAARERLTQAREEAAMRVADAEENAAERIASAEKQAAESIANAERSRVDAVRQAKLAEEELSRARERAREAIQQLAFSLRESVLSEEQAQINLERAQNKVIQARQSAAMSPLDKRQAELDYKQALLDLEEAKDRTQDLTKENQKARKEGVEGSDEVRDAKRRLADANREVADAERELRKTRKEAAEDIAKARRESEKEISRAKREGAQQIKAAQDALNQALKSTADQAASTGAAMDNLGYTMANLSPAARRFAEFLHSRVIPRLREMRDAVQAALLPRMEKAIKAAAPLLDVLQKAFVKTAGTIGDLAIRFGKLAGSKAFRADTAKIMASNDRAIKSFGGAAFYLAEALRHVMVVAGPMVERFARLVENWAKGRAEAAKTGRETGRMERFFDKAWKTASKLWAILSDVAAALRNVGKAAAPTGDTLLDSLARGAEAMRKWTEDPQNQRRLQEFFQNTVPVMEQFADLLGKIAKLFGKLGEATGGHAMDGLFAVLDKFVEALTMLADMPGGGTILTTILILAGAGLGLGIVARAIGRIAGHLVTLARFTGVTKLFGALLGAGGGGGRRSQVGRLADDVGRLTGEIDRELPKDKQKKRALDDVGGAAGKARKPVTGVAGDVHVAGKSMETNAKKASKFSRALGGLKGAAGAAGKGLAGLGGLLLAIPGIGGMAAKLGASLKTAFSKIKLPSIGGKAAAGTAAKGGLLASLTGGLLGKLPSFKGILTSIKTWVAGLVGAVARYFSGGKIAQLAKGAVKGGGKGGAGGPLGIIGGILAGILGVAIGGGKGGARGAAGGAISGGATGAGVGALVGSIVPGIGTAIGAVIGGVVGAVIGAITGGRWWTAIGRFFVTTLPNWVVEQAQKMPGRIAAGIGTLTGLGVALIKWAQGQLGEFNRWLGEKVLQGIQRIPVLIVEAIFLLPRLIAKAAATAPLVFEWVVKQAVKIIPALARWATLLPRTLVKAMALGGFKAGQAFVWLVRQTPAIGAALKRFFTGIPGMIKKSLKDPGAVFGWLTKQAGNLKRTLGRLLDGAMGAIKDAISRGMGDAGRRAQQRLNEIATNFRLARDRWAARVREAMDGVVSSVRNKLASARDWAGRHLNSIKAYFVNAKENVTARMREAFNSVRDGITSRLRQTRDKVNELLGNIRNAFRNAKDYIGRQWDGLKGAVKGPINVVIGVYNDGIRRMVEGLASAIGATVKLPKVNRFARGGIMPGYSPGRDSLLAAVSPGESIFRPEFTRAVGPEWVEVANKIARTQGAKAVRKWLTGPNAIQGEGITFARGGIAPKPKLPGFAGHFAFGGIVGDLIQGVKDFTIGNIEKAAKSVLGKIIGGKIPGSGVIRDVIARIPHWMSDNIMKWIKDKVASFGGGEGLERGLRFARAQHGKPYQWGGVGNPSFDCSGFMSAITNVIKGKPPGNRLFTTHAFTGEMGPAGFVRGARSGFEVGVTHSGVGHMAGTLLGHAVESGGSGGVRVDGGARGAGDGLFTTRYGLRRRDKGGPVYPGINILDNQTGRNEWVLSPRAIDLLGGERVVAALNARAEATDQYRASQRPVAATTGLAPAAAAANNAVVNVYPQRGQTETEIGMIAARKLGAMLK